MAARRIDVERSLDAVFLELLVEKRAVHGRHHLVVVAVEQQRRRGPGIDFLFERELLRDGFVGIVGAEQLHERPLVAFVGVGRNHRVVEDHEIGLHFRKRTHAAGEIAARRGARHPYFRRVYVQLSGHFAHDAQRLVGVVARNFAVTVGQTVFHHGGRDAVFGEPLGLLVAVADRKRRVAAAGEEYQRLSRGIVSGLVDPHFGFLGIGPLAGFGLNLLARQAVGGGRRRVVPEYDMVVLRIKGRRQGQGGQQEQCFFHGLQFILD